MTEDSETRWRELYSRWLTMQAEWACEPEQERGDQLTEEEGGIVLAMASMPVPRRFLEQKLEVLTYVMFHDRPSSWADRRDELLLNSVKADIKQLP